MSRVAITPQVTGLGGVRSFMEKFSQAARAAGVQVTFDLEDRDLDAVLVLAGTRHLAALQRLKRRGVPIVQRLDGINWIQRRRWAGWRYTLRAEYGNWNLAFIRRYLADRIVYQSEFTYRWWSEWYGVLEKPHTVIHNGVDLNRYTPEGEHGRPSEGFRLLVVEGNLAGAQSFGLNWAVDVANRLSAAGLPVQLTVAGRVDAASRAAARERCAVDVDFLGVVPPDEIPRLDRSAHLFISAELNSACPNAVIEALACGTPVVGFDTGALRELVGTQGGQIVPYGGDVWRFEPADTAGLAKAAGEVLANWETWHRQARALAEARFDLNAMTQRYLEFLLG